MSPITTPGPVNRTSIRSFARRAAAFLPCVSRKLRDLQGSVPNAGAWPDAGPRTGNEKAWLGKAACQIPVVIAAIALSSVSATAATNVNTSVSVPTPAHLPSSSSTQTLTVTCSISGSPTPPSGGGGVTGNLFNSSGTSIATTSSGVSNGSSTFTLSVPANISGAGFYVMANYSGYGNGTYTWSASSGTSGTFFIGQATPTITWNTPAAITYGTALSATQLNASAGGVAGTFAYTPASGAVLAAGTQTLSVTFTPTDTTDYKAATQTVSLTVNKATPTISWSTPAAITYGTALSATQLNASAGGVAGSFAYTPASGTVLATGTQTLSTTFTPTDTTDYNSATQTVSLTVNKATPTFTWNAPAAITYGTALSATQLNAGSASVAGTFAYAPASGTVLGVGTQTLSVTFTPADTTDYNSVTRTVSLTVNKATPTITWATPAAIAYGTALSATQLNASAGGVAGTFAYTPASGTVPAAGTQTLSVTFTPTDTTDYNSATQAVSLTVNKATPTITWGTPAAITYGTALSATQLNASAGGVAGTFAYTPASGAVPAAGTQTLSVTFTPTDTTDYNSTTKTVSLTVNKATPTFTWNAPAAITYGTALSATQLNAGSASAAGAFAYTPASGTVLAAGPQTLSTTFSPTDTTDYNSVTQTVSLTVNKATPTFTWNAPAAITYGTALSATQLNAGSASVAGAFAYTPASGTVLGAGTQTLSVTFTPTDTTDYNSVTRTVSLTVNKATPTFTWNAPAAITYGTALSATQLNAGSASVAGAFAYTPASGTVLAAGTQTLSVTFTPTDATDYNSVTQTVSLTVNKVTPTITWNTPAAISYGTALSATQLNASAGGVAGTFNYNPASGTVLGIGTNILAVTFTPTDTTDYNSATKTVSLTVTKATPTITWATPAAITYGTALSATQLNASAGGVAGTFAYTPASGTVLTAGTQTLSVTFTPTDTTDYNLATQTVSLTVNKVTPTFTWGAPAAIIYGTALSATQLNAGSASVPGAFAYTPASGAILGVGTQTLSVTFTPTDTTDYNPVTRTVSLTVNKATPAVTWSTPAAIAYGTALSAAQLNANAGGVAGTFTYTPAGGTLLGVGTNQNLTVVFTPSDTTDYNSANGSVMITVTKATPAGSYPSRSFTGSAHNVNAGDLDASFANPAGTAVSAPTGALTYSYASATGSASGALAVGTILSSGVWVLTASYPGDTNYNPATVSATYIVSYSGINWSMIPLPGDSACGVPAGTWSLAAYIADPGTVTMTGGAGGGFFGTGPSYACSVDSAAIDEFITYYATAHDTTTGANLSSSLNVRVYTPGAPTVPGFGTQAITGSEIDLSCTSSTNAKFFELVWAPATQPLFGSSGQPIGTDVISTASLAYVNSTGTFAIPGLADGTNYAFSVRACSWDGVSYSAWSAPVTIQTLDTEPPVGRNPPQVSNITAVSATVSWTSSVAPTVLGNGVTSSSTFTDNVGVTYYNIAISQGSTVSASPLFTSGTVGLTTTFNWLAPSTTYTCAVYAFDAAGNASGPEAVTFTTPADSVTAPGSVTATYSASGCTLTWSAATSGSSIVGYTIYVNGVPQFAVGPTTLSVTLTNLNQLDSVQVVAMTATGASGSYLAYPASQSVSVSGAGQAIQLAPLVPVVPPSITGASVVAAFGGSVSVDNHGAADYSIPLKIAPGRAGLEPKLALQYNSGAGNGIGGLGWSLSTGFPGSITRGRTILARDGVIRGVTFNPDSDKLYLDGKRLICVSGSYGHPGSVYRTEVDSFVTVAANADPANSANIGSFTVTEKSGVVMTFGKYLGTADAYHCGARPPPNSQFGSSDTVSGPPDTLAYAYALKNVQDTIGNTVLFTYQDLGGGEQVLSRIDYTGNGIGPGNSRVEMTYGPRPDQAVTYVAGDAFNHRARLAGIFAITKATGSDRLAAYYRLNYNDPPVGQPPASNSLRSRLLSVAPALADPQSHALCPCQPVSVTWRNYSDTFEAASVTGAPGTSGTLPGESIAPQGSTPVEQVIAWGDFEGTGKDEWVAAGAGYGSLSHQTILVGDFDGDGKKDQALVTCVVNTSSSAGISIVVTLANGTPMTFEGQGATIFQQCFTDRKAKDGTLIPNSFQLLAAEGGGAVSRISVADFTGDGRDDIAVLGYDGKLYLFVSKGTSFAEPKTVDTGLPTGVTYTPMVGVQSDVTTDVCIGVPLWINDHFFVKAMPCDLNGDGITDYVCMTYARTIGTANGMKTSYFSMRTISYVLSNGDGTFTAPQSIPDLFLPPEITYGTNQQVPIDTINSGIFPGDFNGDGLTDFLVLVNGNDPNVAGYTDSNGVFHQGLYGNQRWVLYLNNGCRSDPANPSAIPLPTFTQYNGVMPANVGYCPVLNGAGSTLDPLNFYNSPDPAVRAFFTSFEGAAGSANNFVMDINHDGIADFVWFDGTGWSAMLSTGRFTSNSTGGPATSSTGFIGPVSVPFLGGVTGGQPYSGSANAAGMVYSSVSRGIDTNGDGEPDYCVELHASGLPTCGADVISGATIDPVADIVSAVTDGLGSTTTIAYKAAKNNSVYTPGAPVSYPIREMRGSNPVVAELYKDAGSGNPADNAHFSYQYSGNRLDLSGRGSLGFHSFVTLDRQTNLFKYQFLTQSFPMTGLTAREQTYRYWESGGNVNFRTISSHDNTVVFDEVADGLGGYGTVYPFISSATENRWEDSTVPHYTWNLATQATPLAASPEPSIPGADSHRSSPELLFSSYLSNPPPSPYITITAQSLFDGQSAVQTTLPSQLTSQGFDPSDTTPFNQNWVAGTLSFSVFDNLPRKITYGNLVQLSTNYGGGYTETVNNNYGGGGVASMGLPGTVTTTVTAPAPYNTGPDTTAPVKTYTYAVINSKQTPLVATETVTATDPNLSTTTTHAYDGRGRVTATSIAGTDLQFEGQGPVSYTVSSVSAFDDDLDLPAIVLDAYGHQTTIQYDKLLGLANSVTDCNGVQVTTKYDALGRKIVVLDQLKNLESDTKFAWDSSQTVASPTVGGVPFNGVATGAPIKNVNGLTLTSAYSVTSVAHPASASTTYLQPPVTTYYDRLGRVIRTIKTGFNNLQIYTDTAYNSLGQVVAVSLPYPSGGPTYWTTTTYDPLGRVSQVTAPNLTTTTNTYKGCITSVSVKATDRDAQINTTLVDAKGRTVAVWNNDNQPAISYINGSDSACTADVRTASVAYALDGFGRMRTTTLNKDAQHLVIATYDALGRQVSLSDPDKGAWSYKNSALGHVLRQTDAVGNVTKSAFDQLGRQLWRTTTEAAGPTENANWYYYDNTDSASLHTVAKGTQGWLLAPERESTSFSNAPGYAGGNLGANSATSTVHYYDSMGRPFIDLATLDGKYFYTCTDYLEPDGTSDYSRVNHVRHYWRPADSQDESKLPYRWQDFGYTYTYGANGYLLSLADTLGRTWWDQPTYDYMDRVTTVRKAGSGGYTTVRTYDATAGTLTGIQTTAGGTTFQNLSYVYDGLGDLKSRSGTGGTESCTYDNLNRLSTSTIGNATRTITYDPLGNITGKDSVGGQTSGAYTYDPTRLHAVTLAFGYSMNYDANGNLLGRTKSGENWNLKWTGFDKPRWMAKITSGNTVGSEFLYNANRSRTMQLEFSSMTGTAPNLVPDHYVRKRIYAMGQTLEINYTNLAGQGAPPNWSLDDVRIYVPGPDGVIGAREFHPPQSPQEDAFIYHYDHLGSIDCITTFVPPPTGLIATTITTGLPGKYNEDPWGQRRNPFTWSGPPVTTGGNASDPGGSGSLTPRGFTGHEMLDDLGLVHMNGRIYDPLLGRFLSADVHVQFPGDLQSFNRYSYVDNNPLRYTDPTGFDALGDDLNAILDANIAKKAAANEKRQASNQAMEQSVGIGGHGGSNSKAAGDVATGAAQGAQPESTPHSDSKLPSGDVRSTDGSKISAKPAADEAKSDTQVSARKANGDSPDLESIKKKTTSQWKKELDEKRSSGKIRSLSEAEQKKLQNQLQIVGEFKNSYTSQNLAHVLGREILVDTTLPTDEPVPGDTKTTYGETFPEVPGYGNVILLNPICFSDNQFRRDDAFWRRDKILKDLVDTVFHENFHLDNPDASEDDVRAMARRVWRSMDRERMNNPFKFGD